MTPRQERFVEEYVVDHNATQAAVRAGYSARTSNAAGSRLLANVDIAQAIYDKQKQLSERTEISAERVVSELARIAFSNIADYYTVDEDGAPIVDTDTLLDPDKAAAVSQIDVIENARGDKTVRIKLLDKKAALVDLGKHLGLFTDRAHVDVTHHREEKVDDRKLAMAVVHLLNQAVNDAADNGAVIDGDTLPAMIEDLVGVEAR